LELVTTVPVFLVVAWWLVEFVLHWNAGQSIRSAARAAAWEATLPKATGQSIAAAASRCVRASSWRDHVEPIEVRVNERPALLWTGACRGDALRVTVSWKTRRAGPRFLERLGLDPRSGTLRATCVAHNRP
jgi:hypothetical protein